MVDFIEASPLRYALTVKPTIYISHIRQFWSTARIETTEEGTQILTTVDGIYRTVTESSLRRNLKLKDEEGISSLLDTELFENITLMGYNIFPNQKFTFQKGQFSHQWKYLIHTIMQYLSPKSIGFNEFSSNIATALVCLATNRTYNFSKIIFDGLVKNVNNKVSKFLMYQRFLIVCLRMSQFGQITHTHTYVVPFHTRKLFTTLRVNSPSFSGRIVPLFDIILIQQGEGSGTPTEPHHTPSPVAHPPSHTTHSSSTLPPVTTTSIPTVTPSKTTPIRQYTRRAKIAQSSALPIVTDEPESPLRDISQGEACPTDSGFIADQDRATIDKSSTLPYDSAPRVTSSAADEGNMQHTLNELTAFYTSLQRQHSELLAKFQAQEVEINRLKERVKLLEAREGVAAERSRDDAPIKGRSLDEGEAAAERTSDDTEEMANVLTSMDAATVFASGATAVPTGSGSIPTVGPPAAEVATGSDVVPTASPVFATAIVEYHQFALELPIERRIELISDLVKYQDNYAKIYKFQSQQRNPLTKKQKRDYYMAVIRNNLGWKVKDFRGFSLEQESAKKHKTSEEVTEEAKSSDEVPEEKHLDREDLNQLWRLVKETLSNRPPTSDQEMELWVELSRLHEPDDEDQLWTYTQNFMHAPVEWKLYDSRGVHHVTSKDKEIFMLVKKDYPLRKGLALVMISYKLQVKNYSRTANDLILKIYKIVNSPRQQGLEFPLAVEVPTTNEEGCHCQKKRDATAKKVALLSKSRRNCQSKSNDSFTKLEMSRGVDEDDTVEAIRRRSKWENDYYICRGHILNGMYDSLFDIYQNVELVKELWDSLESKYMAEDAS
nr:synaptobrevin, longin-like domain protein [Tanacetum cinerariifolium]